MNTSLLSLLRSRFRPIHGTGMPVEKVRSKKEEVRSADAAEPRCGEVKSKKEEVRSAEKISGFGKWVAAAALAAGTLMGGAVPEAGAAMKTINGRIYFDATGWNQTYVQLMIGHSSYSACYTMTNIPHTSLYYVEISNWSGAEFLGFIGDGAEWESKSTSDGASRLTYATKYTAAFTSTTYEFNSGSSYFFRKSSTTNGASLNSAPYISALSGLNAVTYKGTVRVKEEDENSYTNPPSSSESPSITFSSYKISDSDWLTSIAVDQTSTGGTNSLTAACSATATYTAVYDNTQYSFDGWYNGSSQLSSSSPYTTAALTNGSTTVVGRFTRLASTAPEVWATGVDDTSFLLNWSEVEDAGGYDAQVKASSGTFGSASATTWADNFGGWTTRTSATTYNVGPYNGYTYSITSGYVYSTTYGNGVEIRLDTAGTSAFTLPALTTWATNITYTLRGGAAANKTGRTMALEAKYPGASTFTNLETRYAQTNTAYTTFSYTCHLPPGTQIRWINRATGSGTTILLGEFSIDLAGNELGHSLFTNGLTSGATYNARVSAAGTGNWSDTLNVITGVKPSGVQTNDYSTNFVSFQWTGHANATGYKVDATTNPASEGWATQALEQKTYTMNAFGAGDSWYYEGTYRTDAGGTVTQAPRWVTYAETNTCYGHHLGGTPGNALVSTNFPIAGAGGITLAFTVGAWNLNITNTVGLENGRVMVYYRVDDGAWNYFGTAVPPAIKDGSTTNVSFTVPTGGLDGTNIAFKIEAPNATATNYPAASNPKLRFVGPFIREVDTTTTKILTRTAGANAGYYGTNSLTGYPKVADGVSGAGEKTYTVSGLDPETPVYFRVQALQGSDTANPDARSVWVETAGTSLVARVVSFTAASATGVTAGQTASVEATVTQDANEAAPTITYSSSDTTKATVDSDGTVHGVAAGTVTITATAGETAHYTAGASATRTITVRPAAPGTQAELTDVTLRTTNTFRLKFKPIGGSGQGILVLVKAGDDWPDDPTDGVGVKQITAGDALVSWVSDSDTPPYGDARAILNNKYATTSETWAKPVTNATPGTHYHARAFAYSYNTSEGSNPSASMVSYSYNTTSGTTNSLDFWTLAEEPGTAATVSGAKAATDGDTHAVVTYDAGGAGNILLVMATNGATAPSPTDGDCYTNSASTNYPTGAVLGGGYVIYAGAAGSGSRTVNVSGLSGGTTYVVYAFPYNTGTGDDTGTSANYRTATVSDPFTTEAAQGPEDLAATTTRYTMSVSWKAMDNPPGKTITGYTVEATACGGDGAKTTNACPDSASLTEKYDPTKATHGASDAWSYRKSVKSASDATFTYPEWWNTPGGHMLLGRWTTTTYKPAVESPVINLSGAASAEVTFQMRSYESKNGYTNTYAGRSPVTLYWSTNGGTTWTNGAKTGNGTASFAATNLAIPAEALVATAKFQLRADSAAGYSIVANGTTNYYAAGAVVKAISVVKTATATGDYESSGCAVSSGNITVDGTNAVVTGLTTNKLYYYRVRAEYSDGTYSHWTESSATTKGQMEAPSSSASAARYAGTVDWAAPSGESANVTAWHVQLTSCTSGSSDEPVTNACPDGALTYATSPLADAWTYTNRASGYPSWQKWGGYNGGAHFLVGTGGSASSPTPKGIVSEQLNLSGMGSAYVRFMHSPNLQNPIARSYITLYYSLDDGANWTKVETLQDAGQVYPSLVYKELSIALPDAALAEGVYLKLSADSAYQQVTESATNQFGARLEGIEVVATPLRQDWDFGCGSTMTSNYTSLSAVQKAAMGQTFGVLSNATAYGYRVWATDEGGNASATNSGQFTTLAGQAPPVQIWADPIKQTQMKLQWEAATASYSESDAATGASAAGLYELADGAYAPTADATVQEGKTYYTKSGTDATAYEIQMTQCQDAQWERVAIAASPTNARLSSLDDWSYIGGGTDVEAVDGVKLSETTYITAGGIYPTWADGTASYPENSQVLAGEGEPGMMSAVFSTVGATNAVLSFNFGRWYVKGGLANVDTATASNAAVLTAYYSLDGGASWENWFQTESATNYPYTYTGTYGTADQALPAAALGQENVRIKLVAENACIMDVSTRAGSSYVTNHAVGVAVALAQVKLQGVTGDYSSSGCRIDDGTWLVDASAEELSVLVTGLEANSNYYFRVRATDGATDPAQYGEWTDGAARTLAAPDKVTNLAASAIGRYAFTVSWDASARAESYIVKVYLPGGSLQGSYPTESLSQRVTGLSANTTYTVKVVAVADGVAWDETTTSDSTSDAFPVTTANSLAITGLQATGINPESMTIVWDGAGSGENAQNVLTWGETGTDGTAETIEEVLSCPAETLKRTDSGNGWYYVGGSASYPAYWKGSTSGDEGHALIYASGGYPGIRSRWFDTYGATNVTVEFLHGRFNAAANSAVELDYSLDGGQTWTYAGETATSSATTPTDARVLSLPAAALNRKSVMIQLTAPNADGNKGAHIKDLAIHVRGAKLAQTSSKTWSGEATSATSWELTGLTPGKRYWFTLQATDDKVSYACATNTASTYAMRTGVLASQGFESDTTDTTPWTTNVFWIPWRSTGWYTNATREAGYPTVETVENENPLYGRKALRLSGSASANAFGVVDFTYELGNRGGAVTIPFSGKDLAKNDYLYVACKWSDGDWFAPGGTNQTSMGGVPLTRIGCGGSDVLNQNWPYNRGTNTTTRPKGDAYAFEVPAGNAGATLTVRVAFCGQSGGANRYYYIDELSLEELAGVPDPVSATATDDGHVQLAWTSPEGQKVLIIRGQDKREAPATGAPDLSALPEGYEVVMNGTETQWPTGEGSFKDEEATSGWRYYYYFYAVTDSGTIGKTPAVAWTMVRGMVHAIASQGWDGWDAHPWGYTRGRVTNPGRSSDAGYWKSIGESKTNSFVKFYPDEFETDTFPARPSGSASTTFRYLGVTNYSEQFYAVASDAHNHDQLGVSTYTNYYGTNSFRLSGGGGTVYNGSHTYIDFDNETVTKTNPVINTNNAAIQFANVDLSGYKNVEFQMHYAGALQGGGNYLHLAISTNGGAEGTWKAIDNLNSAGWRLAPKDPGLDYGLQLQEMSNKLVGEQVDFYDQTLAQYGNPFVLQVPDSVTQFMARVMFYDSNGRDIGWRYATYFIDEVRLLGEVAMEAPHPVITAIASNSFTVSWTNVPDADRYNVKITPYEADETNAVKLAEAFVAQGAEGWTASGSVGYPAGANRQGGSGALGYGVALTTKNDSIASPELGGVETVSFYARAATAGSESVSLVVETLASGETEWEALASYTATALGTDWTQYTVSLPHRQWQQIRFRRDSSVTGHALHIDDVTISGSGRYTLSGTLDAGGTATTTASIASHGAVTNLAATNFTFTGLSAGTRYFVEVQAVNEVEEDGTAYELASDWKSGETADYTAGEFHAEADGFELVRMGWAAPGDGMVVIAVTNGDASAVSAPAKDAALAVGTQVVAGSAVVVASNAAAASAFEHVWPYNGDGAEAQYVVFWKHGGYWEGRLETNVATGVYVCQAADAFAVTNDTYVAGNTDTSGGPVATPFGGGKGWDGNWQLTVTHGGSWHAVDAVRDGTPEGLVETNQLWGAGGNMLAFRPGDNTHANSWVGMRRKLATPLGAESTDEWWGMFAMKLDWQGSDKWAGLKLLDSSGTDVVAIGKVEGGDNAAVKPHDGTATRGGSTIANGTTNVFVFRWKDGKMSLHVEAIGSGWAGWDPSNAADLTKPDSWTWQVTDCPVSTMAEVHYVMLEAANRSEYVNNVHFDEIRIGPDWPSLIGKQELPPCPAYDLEAVRDGNEMVRLGWKYRAGGINADGSANALMEHANGVVVLATTNETGFTAAEIAALRTAAVGTTSGDAEVIWRSDVATSPEQASDELDHVVMPGTTHRYAVITRNGSAYTNAVASDAVSTDLYGEREWVNPFSYTNNVSFSNAYPANWATTYQGTWKGGQGFETGQTQHYWAQGGAGTWTPVKPATADAAVHITNAIANYPPGAGNVMKFVPGDQANGYLKRNLNSAWCGNAGDTFYVAFRMAYQWNGNNKWAGLRFIDNGGSSAHSILFGKVGTASAAAGIAGVPSGGSSEGNWAGASGSLDDYGNSSDTTHAYLVVGKVTWTASGTVTASLYALQTGAGGATLPTSESAVAWTVTQSGLQLRNVNQFQLEAGATSGNGDIGEVYFDEIRFGTAWDDILGPADPTDVRMARLASESNSETPATTAYLGDFIDIAFLGTPVGKKQTGAGWLSHDGGETWGSETAATEGDAVTVDSVTWAAWTASNAQFTATGSVRAGGSVTGSSVTLNSWERATAAWRYRLYDVNPLPAPTPGATTPGKLRNTIAWTQASGENARTFPTVMLVRFESDAARSAWDPDNGTVYAAGETHGGGRIVYVGTGTSATDTGLSRATPYWYALYTVNNAYHSARATAACTTLDADPDIPTVDGDPTDWVGVPSETKNSATTSEGEWIWTDKAGEQRTETDACASADIREFRVKADENDVYFLLRLAGGTGTAATNAYVAVGLTTAGLSGDGTADANNDGMKWLADESATTAGGAYWQTNAAAHWFDQQMSVHYVASDTNCVVVELYAKDGGRWYGTTNWAAAASAAGADDACFEWSVPRDALGLTYTSASGCITGRFTVATFLNNPVWNNDASGTVKLSDTTCRAVDAMAVAPYGVNDGDLALGAMDEGLKNKVVDFWADVKFGNSGVKANDKPGRPTPSAPANNAETSASPTMTWSQSSDSDGFVTGYLVEVATNATFGGTGSSTENGAIACRINVEGAETTSWRFVTDSSNYWWRVRARDNAGELSAATAWKYTVVGKLDTEGPVAKLLYVGTNVMKFLNDPAYRAEEERSGDATSVLDSELEDGGHHFGFVIEWRDSSGVYAMNKMRSWDSEHDREGTWPDNKPVGSFAWNTYSTHGGTDIPYGRVSPNWDLLIVDRNTPESATAPSETVDGTTISYVWTNALTLPTENGGSESVACWFIDCGKDTVFWEEEILAKGNSDLCITNYVTNAFSISTYRPGTELYLTVSAEDSCTETGDTATSGDAGWVAWPTWNGSDPGSYKGLAKSEQSTVLSGWCADGPHLGRNVTTNQLLKFYVRDNDTDPPVSSTAKWGSEVGAVDANGNKLYPMLAVARTNAASAPASWNPTWANLTDYGLLPAVEGEGRLLTWQLTDADLTEASPGQLRFFFNVYDEYIHSGVKRGTADPSESVTKVSPPSTRTLTNSAFRTRTWDETANDGAGGWVDGLTNRANFASSWSKVTAMTEEGTDFVEKDGDAGTGPNTVLAWQWDATLANVETLFGMENILTYIGTNSLGATNVLLLDAWDSDNNTTGDQAHDEIEFGRLVFTDDDATPPESPGYSLLGTGTNFVQFGALAGWAQSASGTTATSFATNKTMKGIEGSILTGQYIGKENGTSNAPVQADRFIKLLYGLNKETFDEVKGKYYFTFSVQGRNGAEWTADTLSFSSFVSKTGPTNFALTVMQPANLEECTAVAGGVVQSGWTTDGTTQFEKSGGLYRFKMVGKDAATASLASPNTNTTGKAVAKVSFRVGWFGTMTNSSGEAIAGTLTVAFNNETLAEFTSSSFAATAAQGGWLDVEADLATGASSAVTWSATNLTSGTGFVVRDAKIITQTGYGDEDPLVTRLVVEKDLDDDGNEKETTKTVTMTWTASPVTDGGERQYRLYGWGATNVSGTWGVNDVELHGISSLPKGFEVTDADLLAGSWTNALEIIDGAPTGYDTAKSGICVTNDASGFAAASGPTYALKYPEAYAGHAGETATSGSYALLGLTAAQYTALEDGSFETGGWTFADGAEAYEWGRAKAGTKVLRLPGDGTSAASAATNIALAFGTIGEGNISGATASGTLCLRALSTTGDGVDNTVTVTLALLDGSGNELGASAQTFTASHMAWWDEIALEPLSVDSASVRTARVSIAQTGETATEVYVDDVDIRVALWGAETAMAGKTAEQMRAYNGIEGAKLRFATDQTLGGPGKTLPLSAEMTGEGSKAYALCSTVRDYDRDREDDALSVTATNEFTLYDDDAVAPQLGWRFGGALGARLGVDGGAGGSEQPCSNSGEKNDIVVSVSDRDLCAARSAYGENAKLYFDIDGYDYSGWETRGVGLAYDGTETMYYTNTADIATLTMTGVVLHGEANLPAAVNTLASPVAHWWGNADVRAEFAKTANADRSNLTVNATIVDGDDDRANDAMAYQGRVGYLRFLDSDSGAPFLRNTSTKFYKRVFIGTNDLASVKANLTKTGNSSWSTAGGMSPRDACEMRVNYEHGTDNYSNLETRVYRIYDGELTNDAPFFVIANLGDLSGNAKGQSIAGIRRGTTESDTVTNAFGDSFTVSNTAAWLCGGDGTVVSNLVSRWSGTDSGEQSSTRGTAATTMQTWLIPNGMTPAEVGNLLPEGMDATNLTVKFDIWDDDTDRAGDQMHAQTNGPAIWVRDDDTTAPTAPGAAVLFKGGRTLLDGELAETNRYTVPWVNTLEGLSIHFTEAEDVDGRDATHGTADAQGLYDLDVSGIGAYRFAAPNATPGAEIGAALTLGEDSTDDGVAKKTASLALEGMEEGWGAYQLFAVDDDNDRPGDALAGPAATVALGYDRTPPTSLSADATWTAASRTNKMTASSEFGNIDPTSEMRLDWTACGVTMQPNVKGTSATSGEDALSPWKSYKIYMKTYTATGDGANFDDVSSDIADFESRWTAGAPTRDGAEGWTSVMGDASKFSDLTNSTTQNITLTDLEPGENYVFAVVGVDKAGNESRYPVYALGDTIKFIVTQGVVRAWSAISNDLKAANFEEGIFAPTNTTRFRGTASLYWDARLSTNAGTVRAPRAYSLVYRDGYAFEETNTLTTLDAAGREVPGWGRIAGNSISNNFYADPDSEMLAFPRGKMRFYRATYAGREFATNGIVPLASEEVYALHNVKLSQGRNFVALHGVPYTNTFAGVFGTDTTFWPAGSTMADATRVEFFDGLHGTNTVASGTYWFGTGGKWYQGNGTGTEVTDTEQAADFFTRGFAINLPERSSGFYATNTVDIVETVVTSTSTNLSTTSVPVFEWAPILQMPTNDAEHAFTSTVHCGTWSTHTVGRKVYTSYTGVDTFVAFRAPVSVHPSQLGLTMVSDTTAANANGFVYNTDHPERGDRLLIWAAATKDARIAGDESDCGDGTHGLGATSQMYYDGTDWRWYAGEGVQGTIVGGTPIRPNDAIVIRSFNGGVGNSWTWSYTPTNLYPVADRHFGH